MNLNRVKPSLFGRHHLKYLCCFFGKLYSAKNQKNAVGGLFFLPAKGNENGR
jgi:hypothetical protein